MSNSTIYIRVSNANEVVVVRDYLNKVFDVVACFSKNAGQNFKDGLYCVKVEKDNNVFHVYFETYVATKIPQGGNVFDYTDLKKITESVFGDKYDKIDLGSRVKVGSIEFIVSRNLYADFYGLYCGNNYMFYQGKSKSIKDFRLKLKEDYGNTLEIIKY